jgi:rare lipoprotein A
MKQSKTYLIVFCFVWTILPTVGFSQTDSAVFSMNDTGDLSPFFLKPRKQKNKVLFGVASYYGDKFEGRKTASGDIFNQQKMTAACNKLPLGTRIRVTNIRNGKTVEVVVNDRLHPKMKRIVDLTKSAAKKLGYVDHGLTKVRVEVIGKVNKNKN